MSGERYLVVRLGAIGDCLRALPAVRRLRRSRPQATIGWAVEDWVYPVLAGNPNVDRFHVLRRSRLWSGARPAVSEIRRFLGEVRGEAYDVVLDFHGRLKSGLVSRLSGAGRRIGYSRHHASEGNYLFNNQYVDLDDPWENRVLRFLRLLAPLGLNTNYDPSDLGLYIHPDVRIAAQRWYDAQQRPQLAVYPGSSRRRTHERWPARKWVELLRRTGRENIGSVVFWGPAEHAVAEAIATKAGPRTVLAPPTTLPEMMAMIGCFRAFAGSETGAMHMAWMQGVPTAVFVGGRPPRNSTPLAPVPSYVLRAQEYVDYTVGYNRQPDEVVSAVPVGEAMEAIEQLLAAGVEDRAERLRRTI
jgi:ADP-heptose:LPS heptosyltransferase